MLSLDLCDFVVNFISVNKLLNVIANMLYLSLFIDMYINTKLAYLYPFFRYKYNRVPL